MDRALSRWLVDSWVAISRDDKLFRLETRLRDIIKRDVPDANPRETGILLKSAMQTARRARMAKPGSVVDFVTSARVAPEMEKAAWIVENMMRKRNISAPSGVFFAISTHQKPRDSHAVLQGTVCYDKHWRQHVESGLMYSVWKYIKENNLKSAQELMGPPIYLITSPNCRHRFIPLDTREVLDGTANTVIRDGAPRSKSPTRLYREKKMRRMLARSRATPRELIKIR